MSAETLDDSQTTSRAGQLRPYRIEVPDAVLTDLASRLERTRWPAQIPGSGWSYGADMEYVKELCDYWRTGYDWRAHERRLNEHQQYLVEVDGLDLHVIHVKGKGDSPIPLLLIHGWPGSVYEFCDLIGPLTDPVAYGGDAGDAFDVVIPSLPGFGFSGKPQEPGWGPTRIASQLNRLMTDVLDYPRYAVQGGDWGSIISLVIAAAHNEQLVGAHLNLAPVAFDTVAPLSEEGRATLADIAASLIPETGYVVLQSTKPDTVTPAQSDSPAGLAAWMIDKFRSWSDCDGDVEKALSKDQILTNLMFYWATNSVASAARLYYEAGMTAAQSYDCLVPDTPIGVADFPGDYLRFPRSLAQARLGNIVQWTEMPAGGHFAALEQPDLLVKDVRAFFRRIR